MLIAHPVRIESTIILGAQSCKGWERNARAYPHSPVIFVVSVSYSIKYVAYGFNFKFTRDKKKIIITSSLEPASLSSLL